MSHELKTPISAIKGCTEILLNGAKNDPQTCDEFLTIIQDENNRMEQLVKDLLLINRYEHDQIKHNTDRVCLNELLTDCIVQTLNIANLKNQKIMLEATEDYSLDGDYIKLQHCFLNLLTNAIHYSGEDERLRLESGNVVQISKLKSLIKESGFLLLTFHIFLKDSIEWIERDHVIQAERDLDYLSLHLLLRHTVENIKVKSELNKGSKFIVTLPQKRRSKLSLLLFVYFLSTSYKLLLIIS